MEPPLLSERIQWSNKGQLLPILLRVIPTPSQEASTKMEGHPQMT